MRRIVGILAVFVSMMFAITFVTTTVFAQDDYSRYDIEVALDPEAHILSGVQQIEYVNDTEEDLDSVLFLLLGNFAREPNPHIDISLLDDAYPEGFDPGWTKIHEVTDASGQAVSYVLEAIPPYLQTFSLDETILRVHLPQPLAPGERVTLNVAFETKFPHALNIDGVFYREIYTWRFGWNPIAMPPAFLNQEQLTFPAAHYRAKLTLPADFVLAAGADRQIVESSDETWQTILLENDVPVRSIALVMGKGLEVVTLHHEKATIESYYLPGHQSQARLAASYAASLLDDYSEQFGPYSYQRLVIVDNPSPGGYGMAADGIILLGTDNYRYKDSFIPGFADKILEWLIAHEVGHLWWGIGVGTDFNAENWISEAFAQYLSITFFEDKYGGFGPNLLDHLGKGVLEDFMKAEFGYLNLRHHNVEITYLDTFKNRFDEAIVKPSSQTEYVNTTAFRIYNKGYMVLRALEGLLGREMMLDVLKTVYEQYGHKTASVKIFQEVAEEVSGQDLDAFFDSWLYSDDFIDVGVTAFATHQIDTAGYETTVQLTKRGQAVYPVTIALETEDGEILEQTWLADAETGSLTFNSASPAKTIQVDPQEFAPDINRYNNHSPRKWVVKFGEADLPLDAYFIRVDPTSVQGVFGLDHNWGVAIVPRVEVDVSETDEASDESDETDLRIFLDGIATFSARLDRGLSLSGALTATGYELDLDNPDPTLQGELGVNWTLFEHPNIGMAGKFWYPANQFRLSVGVLGTLTKPLGYVGFDVARLDFLKLNLSNRISLRAGLNEEEPFLKASWSGYKRLRLLHKTYLDSTLRIGGGISSLPEAMRFSLSELKGFNEIFLGNHKLFGRFELVLPAFANIDFSLLNLALVERITASAFIQGGQVWNDGEAPSFETAKIEIGAQATITVGIAFGLQLDFKVGYAYPWIGSDEETESMGQIYVDFASPF